MCVRWVFDGETERALRLHGAECRVRTGRHVDRRESLRWEEFDQLAAPGEPGGYGYRDHRIASPEVRRRLPVAGSPIWPAELRPDHYFFRSSRRRRHHAIRRGTIGQVQCPPNVGGAGEELLGI